MKTHRFLLVATVVLAFVSAASAFPKITELIRYYGRVTSATISGDYTYFSTTNCLGVLDISDLLQPQLINFQDISSIRGLFIEGDYLFATRKNTLSAYSLNDPTFPTPFSSISFSGYSHYHRVHDGILGMTSGNVSVNARTGIWYYSGALQFIDANNPQDKDVAFHSNWYYKDFDWNGDYAYVCANQGNPRGDEIQIWNLAHEPHPELVTTIHIFTAGMLIHQNRLIAINHTLQSFSLDDPVNPSDPTTFPEFPDSSRVFGYLYMKGDTLYVEHGDIWLYDLSDPVEPAFISHYEAPEGFDQVKLDGDRMMARTQEVIYFFDAFNLADIFEASRVEFSEGSALRVQTSGNQLTLAAKEDGVYCYSLADDPTSPQQIFHLTGENDAADAVWRGDYLYCCITGVGLVTYDISDPQHPVQTELFEGRFPSLAVWDDLLYALDNYAGLNIYQLDDPAHPQLLSQNRNIRNANSMRIEYPRLYAYYSENHTVVDISNPEQTELYHLTLPVDEWYATKIVDFEAIGDYGFELVGYCNDLNQTYYDMLWLFVMDISTLGEFSVLDSFRLNSSTHYDLYNIGEYLGFTSGSLSYALDPEAIVRDHELIGVSTFGADAPPISTSLLGSTLYTASGSALTVYDMSDFVGVPEETLVPENPMLLSSYPNPFNAVTRLTYSVPSAGNVNLSVFDMAGRQVATLYEGAQTAGTHAVNWDAEGMTSGIYIIRLSNVMGSRDTKVLLMK